MSRTKTCNFDAFRVVHIVLQFYFESFTSFFPASHLTAFVLYS